MKKTLLAFLVVALAAIPARAQLFRPSVVQGAVLGGVVGAVIGHNDDRHGAEGAAIGAVAGALLGAALDRHDSRPVIAAPAPVVYAPPAVYCPPPPARVVYVQTTPVYVAPACPPPSRVVYYGYRPAPVVVYQSGGYCRPVYREPVVYVHGGWGHSGRGHGHGRWR
ncbi:MAG: YMGG-like Gly-zipper [Rariglobus sp.]|jgi:hypothetical protein|nr:YMGG-like Gly-zipper [Rariglobus sp.]